MKKQLIKATAAFTVATLMAASFVMSGKGQPDGSIGTTLKSLSADAVPGCEGPGVCSLNGKTEYYAPV